MKDDSIGRQAKAMDREMRILVVDDEDIVHKSCQRILRNDNYLIDSAYSAEEGLEKLEQSSYDLILSDLMMPGMGGMEFLRIIKEKKINVTVVIFTGYATAETARKALKMGAFDYIPKPFTPDEFREVVRNALESQKQNSDTPMLDLMAIVSHELKSPVSVVHTTAETLHGGYLGDLEPQQQEIVEKIIRNVNYLEDIIRTYLDLSKMELDNMESFTQEIDLVTDVINPVLEIPEYRDNYRGMRLVTDFAPVPRISADPNLLKIVVTNLVNNAIKYGRDKTDIIITLRESAGAVRFSVRNEGVGISRDDIQTKLFNKFVRLKQKGTEGIKGTGLGSHLQEDRGKAQGDHQRGIPGGQLGDLHR
jgi:signal transduction histidine kinase